MNKLNSKSLNVLEMVAAGHTYEQILAAYPTMSYLDIFMAAREALTIIGQKSDDYASRLEKIRKAHPRAYEKWSEEEDDNLIRLFREGKTPKEMAFQFQRQPSAIRSRLIKLNLVEPDIN
jgi:hypothetical protein